MNYFKIIKLIRAAIGLLLFLVGHENEIVESSKGNENLFDKTNSSSNRG